MAKVLEGTRHSKTTNALEFGLSYKVWKLPEDCWQMERQMFSEISKLKEWTFPATRRVSTWGRKLSFSLEVNSVQGSDGGQTFTALEGSNPIRSSRLRAISTLRRHTTSMFDMRMQDELTCHKWHYSLVHNAVTFRRSGPHLSFSQTDLPRGRPQHQRHLALKTAVSGEDGRSTLHTPPSM